MALDKPALSLLPAERFDLSEWSRARVNIDYHIAFDSNYYSVPYNLDYRSVDSYAMPTSSIRYFQRKITGSALTSAK